MFVYICHINLNFANKIHSGKIFLPIYVPAHHWGLNTKWPFSPWNIRPKNKLKKKNDGAELRAVHLQQTARRSDQYFSRNRQSKIFTSSTKFNFSPILSLQWHATCRSLIYMHIINTNQFFSPFISISSNRTLSNASFNYTSCPQLTLNVQNTFLNTFLNTNRASFSFVLVVYLTDNPNSVEGFLHVA